MILFAQLFKLLEKRSSLSISPLIRYYILYFYPGVYLPGINDVHICAEGNKKTKNMEGS